MSEFLSGHRLLRSDPARMPRRRRAHANSQRQTDRIALSAGAMQVSVARIPESQRRTLEASVVPAIPERFDSDSGSGGGLLISKAGGPGPQGITSAARSPTHTRHWPAAVVCTTIARLSWYGDGRGRWSSCDGADMRERLCWAAEEGTQVEDRLLQPSDASLCSRDARLTQRPSSSLKYSPEWPTSGCCPPAPRLR